MERINGVVQSKAGRVVVGAIIQVFLRGTTTPATIYASNATTTPIAELKTDNEGEWGCYIANGRYDIFTVINGKRDGEQLDVLVYDPADVPPATLETSVDPTSIGQMVIEATSDTLLTFKLTGSDGVIRIATLTLTDA